MSRVVHFEIHVDDIERAKAFYAAVFGWEYQDWGHITGSPYFGIITGPDDQMGINGGMLERAVPPAGNAANAYVCTIAVADYDETHEKIMAAGGQVALPKMALGEMAWQGYYLDTEGNTFGVHQVMGGQ